MAIATTSARDTNLEAQQRLGELLTARDIDSLDEIFATDVVDHDPAPGQPDGVAGIKEFWTTFLSAFPDATMTPQVVSADDEHVTVVLDVEGTHTGEFQGIAPSGKRIKVRGIQVGRFADGKLVERWGATDEAGILTQIGAA
ncbi:ester cyclase [Naasia lichenicola]|uniref:Ester cyclase n=1 Tax=Naasia lichenicola TaxID=2565933 RepID=A0A4S4FQ59_9MICO|nr:ester cyclase [Naasia lichenicola]THG31745.1 ester cyclase [Naasia lichenicola]